MLKRRKNVFEKLENSSIALFYSGYSRLKSNDQKFPFSVNRNFYYLTGINQENVVLMLVKGEKNIDEFLFLDEVDPVKALWDGATLSFEEASKISGIKVENIKKIAELDSFISNIISVSRRAIFGDITYMYFDLDKEDTSGFLSRTEIIANDFTKKYPFISIKNSNRIMASLRMKKDDQEVKLTNEAIKITNKALQHVMKSLRPNMNESEIEAEYNYILNKNGVETSFDTIVASGKNGTVLHYVDNNDNIGNNELVLFDLGVKYGVYCSDISRTYPANGTFTKRQKEIYEIVLDANKKTIAWLKPGLSMKEFNEYGKKILIDGLKKIGLIKDNDEITKYYYHSLGHYLGLDVHDVGLYEDNIPVGAIITVEPGLYIAEEAIGIRIEDNILITEKGAINLSKDIIKEVNDIEEFMKK
ncbi:MAG: aminopeptidase P family protein [Acholeplasma sp.]|nr:aminopeptidase P family protein [Acholeplasma sp.]